MTETINNLKQNNEIFKALYLGEYKTENGYLESLREDLQVSKKESYLDIDNELLEVKTMRKGLRTSFEVSQEKVTNQILKEIEIMKKRNYSNNIMVLSFANPIYPGGGFFQGYTAQEESIFRNTTILPSIWKCRKLYSHNMKNRNKGLYTDAMIVSKNVHVIRGTNYRLIRKNNKGVTVITSPAVNYKIAKKKNIDEKEIIKTMESRIDKILNLAYQEGADTLILGAFGCGEFGNSPEEICNIFKKLLTGKYENIFTKVVFAITVRNKVSKDNYAIFKNTFEGAI